MTKRRKPRWSTEISLGKDHFYLELQDHGLPDQGLVNQQLFENVPGNGDRTCGDE